MQDLIYLARPNANKKYYAFFGYYIDRLTQSNVVGFSMTVEEILKDTQISRPTFYSYYQNVSEFYKDLTRIYLQLMPEYMKKLSTELQTDDFLEVIFQMRTGIAISNIKKLAGFIPDLNEFWTNYYREAVAKTSGWYINEFEMAPEDAVRNARLVLNELLINGDLYYNDIDTYKSLMREQKIMVPND